MSEKLPEPEILGLGLSVINEATGEETHIYPECQKRFRHVSNKYILGADGEPVLCPSTFEWGEWMETADLRVARDSVFGRTISTVFLGVGVFFTEGGAPLIFETMVFIEEGDAFRTDQEFPQERWESRAAALAGHIAAVERVRAARMLGDGK